MAMVGLVAAVPEQVLRAMAKEDLVVRARMVQVVVVGAMVVMAGSREMDSVAGTKEKVA